MLIKFAVFKITLSLSKSHFSTPFLVFKINFGFGYAISWSRISFDALSTVTH